MPCAQDMSEKMRDDCMWHEQKKKEKTFRSYVEYIHRQEWASFLLDDQMPGRSSIDAYQKKSSNAQLTVFAIRAKINSSCIHNVLPLRSLHVLNSILCGFMPLSTQFSFSFSFAVSRMLSRVAFTGPPRSHRLTSCRHKSRAYENTPTGQRGHFFVCTPNWILFHALYSVHFIRIIFNRLDDVRILRTANANGHMFGPKRMKCWHAYYILWMVESSYLLVLPISKCTEKCIFHQIWMWGGQDYRAAISKIWTFVFRSWSWSIVNDHLKEPFSG